ncbi:MAG: T9SS C-terminal target domain-containing protein [Calditrichaeota bacterium]|nr:MAG: T9SS C-terminal target domain-containing protein [Calditrichota bacterium]
MKFHRRKLYPRLSLLTFILIIVAAINPLTNRSNAYGASKDKNTKANKSVSDAGIIKPGVIILKMKTRSVLAKALHPMAVASLANKIQDKDIIDVRQLFPKISGENSQILQNIYTLHFAPEQNPEKIAQHFASDPNVEYAEPQYIHKILQTPNDAFYANQTYTDVIAVEPAWDITKGEEGDVVIAILDGGTDWQHPDLIDNIWTNEDEIADNGIDDDGNGYIDDIHGWNFATNSDDPTGLESQTTNKNHGTHVAGIAGARTNNEIGVAGMSWNCKIMPVCIAGDVDGDVPFGYQGIVYAVENGADIINCSWGSASGGTSFGQDIINFAHANGALVVAAAGNDNANSDYTPFYPAQFLHVLSVGSSTDKDDKVISSNYGWSVDVFAPGQSIYSTYHGSNYSSITGTSMACPVVSGIAALVKTKYPNLKPDQLKEYVRQTADMVTFTDETARNNIAKGRINAVNALTAENLIAVRLISATFTDADGSGIINDGEDIVLNLAYENILHTTDALQVKLRTPNVELNLIDSVATLPAMATGDTARVSLTFHVASGTPDNRRIAFFVETSGQDYIDYEVMRFVVNPPVYLDHDSGTLLTSITSSGNLGYIGFADAENGSGFTFNGQNTLFEGGLMVGVSNTQVSNCLRTADGERANDFTLAQGTNMVINKGDGPSDEHGYLTMIDSLADNPIGVQIQQDSYIYYDEPFNDFIIVKYTMTNLNSSQLTNLFAGIFIDWDVNESAQDYAKFSEQHNLGWVQNTLNQPRQLSGTMLLNTDYGFGYKAISNEVWIYDAFTDAEKMSMLSADVVTEIPNGVDVSTIVSTGPISLDAGESKVIGFALVAGESEIDIKNNAESAQLLWDNNLLPPQNSVPPQLETSVILNPVNSKYATITVMSDKSLLRPPQLKIIHNQDSSNIAMSRIPGLTTGFSGTHEFTNQGIYQLMTSAQPKFGADTTIFRDFTLNTFIPGSATTISSTSGDYLYLPETSLVHDSYILAENTIDAGENILNFSPQLTLASPGKLTLKIDTDRYPDMQVAIVQQSGASWEKRATSIDMENRLAVAEIEKLTRFKLVEIRATDISEKVPTGFYLQQNYPNPFNPQTRIDYGLAETSPVEIVIFNALGQKVKTFRMGMQQPGRHFVIWNGFDAMEKPVTSGVYFYKLKSEQKTIIRKMLLLR